MNGREDCPDQRSVMIHRLLYYFTANIFAIKYLPSFDIKVGTGLDTNADKNHASIWYPAI
jgi:hypothetical protein